MTITCSNFERSGYKILNCFDLTHPRSVNEVCQQLHESKARIFLLDTGTIPDYIESLYRVRDIAEKGTGYVLTLNGKRELERLTKLTQEIAS